MNASDSCPFCDLDMPERAERCSVCGTASAQTCVDASFIEHDGPHQQPRVRFATRDSFPCIVAEWCAWPPEGA